MAVEARGRSNRESGCLTFCRVILTCLADTAICCLVADWKNELRVRSKSSELHLVEQGLRILRIGSSEPSRAQRFPACSRRFEEECCECVLMLCYSYYAIFGDCVVNAEESKRSKRQKSTVKHMRKFESGQFYPYRDTCGVK